MDSRICAEDHGRRLLGGRDLCKSGRKHGRRLLGGRYLRQGRRPRVRDGEKTPSPHLRPQEEDETEKLGKVMES